MWSSGPLGPAQAREAGVGPSEQRAAKRSDPEAKQGEGPQKKEK